MRDKQGIKKKKKQLNMHKILFRKENGKNWKTWKPHFIIGFV
jgi:hypothetical protein